MTWLNTLNLEVTTGDKPYGNYWIAVSERPSPFHNATLNADGAFAGWVLDSTKALNAARESVDRKAEQVRLRYVPQPMVVPEYQEAESEASSFKAAGYSGSVPPSVSSWASAKGWAAQQAADDILAAATMLRGKLMQIRSVRLAGKEAIAAGKKTLDQVLAELEAL